MAEIKIKQRERHSLSGGHWYRFLPRKWQYYVMHLMVKLHLVKRYDRVTVTVHRQGGDITVHGYNLIPDVGIKKLGEILVADETTDIDLAFLEPGEGTTTPAIGDTDVEDPLEGSPHPARLPFTTQTVSASSPFEIEIAAFISTADYTRPQTISELTVWWNDDPGTKLFGRAVLASGIVLNTGDTATLTYGIIFR